MKKQLILIALSAIGLASCKKSAVNQDEGVQPLGDAAKHVFTASAIIPATTVDANATTETVNLLHNLQKTALTGVLFGHQDDRIQGTNWTYIAGKSDIKDMVGEYPAMVGHELGNIEIDLSYNADGMNFQKIKQSVLDTYKQGGVVSLLWCCRNPVDSTEGRKYVATDSTIRKLFKAGNEAYLARYCRWMDKLANFVKNLKDSTGKPIPILFRTLHEQNGGWFWWGNTHCKAYEYVTMWRYTVNYLKYTAGVHNLLYVYCPSSFASQAEYEERYPGDNYIDILAADIYDQSYNHSTFPTRAGNMITTIQTLAQTKNKPFGLTEAGINLVPYSNWWTGTLKPLIQNKGMSFVSAWRNVRNNNNPTNDVYYCAYPGQGSAADFVTFHADTTMYFATKAAAKNLYLP